MATFYVSFGVGYAHSLHPYWMGAHPDGWLEVVAPDEEAARLVVRKYVGLKFGTMYDRTPGWARRGRLATVTNEGCIWAAEGVVPPTPRFTPSDPEYHGHDDTELVAARIEGELFNNSDQDALNNLGYEVELVHRGCLSEGLAMFKEVTDVDSRVLAGELDWADPHECPVCNTSIT